MTTGNYSFGGRSTIGAFSSKNWSGSDSIPKRARGWPTSTLLNVDGIPLDLRYATREEISEAHIRRKGLAIKRGLERTAKKDRRRPDNPYNCRWRKGVNAPMTNEYKSTYPFESMFGGLTWNPNAWTSNDDLKLVSKLRSELQGGDFNLGLFLAESNQAINMIAGSALKIANAMRETRKGNFAKARSILFHGRIIPKKSKSPESARSLANSWLELQYGWKPLIDDMESAAHFLAWTQYSSSETVVRVSRRIESMPGSASPTLWGVEGYGFIRKTIIARITAVDRVKLSGLTDAASILWEKLPWSFVADWVVPIGSYLEALNTNSSIQASYVTTTVGRYYGKPDRNVILSGNSWRGAQSYWCAGGFMSRTVSTSLNVNLPSVKPREKIATVGHALNALALMTQQALKLESVRSAWAGRNSYTE